MKRSIDDSLTRLGVDHIDIALILDAVLDVTLIAVRYTLLDQEAQEELFPLATEAD